MPPLYTKSIVIYQDKPKQENIRYLGREYYKTKYFSHKISLLFSRRQRVEIQQNNRERKLSR